MTLPISVIIPHIPSRTQFFTTTAFPSVLANDPAEIIVIRQGGGASKRRNAGAVAASQEFLYFCDDDVVLKQDTLRRLLAALTVDPDAAFAYGDFEHVSYPGIEAPVTGRLKSGPFDADRLRKGNYISTMSLIRRCSFPGFDSSLEKFEDWDLWLTLLDRGAHGAYVPEVLHESHHIDRGLLMTVPSGPAVDRIMQKHGRAPKEEISLDA